MRVLASGRTTFWLLVSIALTTDWLWSTLALG